MSAYTREQLLARAARLKRRAELAKLMALHRAMGPLRRIERHGASWAVEYSTLRARGLRWLVQSWHATEDEARRAAL